MPWLCCFGPVETRENQQGTTQLVTAAGAFPAASLTQSRVPSAPGAAIRNSQPDANDAELVAAEEQETVGPLVQPAGSVHSSGHRAGAAPAATDLSSLGVHALPSPISRGSPISATAHHLAALDAQESPGAPHPPRLNNLPTDTAAETSNRVEEWLSFSLSGSHRSPVSSPRSDHDPLPPGAPDGAESCDLPPPPEVEMLAISKEELRSASPEPHKPGPAHEPLPPTTGTSAPLAAENRQKSWTCSEVSAVPDEVLSSIQQIAGVSAGLQHRSSGAGTSGGLLTSTGPPTLGAHARSSVSPAGTYNRSGSANSHASHLSHRIPLGEPTPLYSTAGNAGASWAGPSGSPTRVSHLGAAIDNSGRSSPHSAALAAQLGSPAPSPNGGVTTPSRIVLEGALSMLHNRSSEQNASKVAAPIPDALSQALASLHARSSNLDQPSRGAPKRSMSHGSTQHPNRQNASGPLLRRPHSIHQMSSQRVGDQHATTYPPEPPRRCMSNRTSAAQNGQTGSTASSAHPFRGPSAPLIVPTGLPGGSAMQMRVTKMFFGSEDGEGGHMEGGHGLHHNPVLDTSQETQVTMDADASGATSLIVPSLGVLEQPEHDTLSSTSSSLSLITPLQHHTGASSRSYAGAPKPDTEEKRMRQMCKLNVLGTAPEERYDRITSLVAKVFAMPVVLVSLVDKDRQWFKSVVGLRGVTETSREQSFCAWTLLPQVPECLVVSDARTDARFRNHVLVSGPPHIQFYAGCPLVSSSGQRLGSLCAIDMRTRFFTSEDCNLLCNLAELVVRELEVVSAQEQQMFDANDAAEESLRPSEAWDVGLLVLHIGDKSWRIRHANARAGEILGVVDLASFIGTDFWDFFSLKEPPPGVHPSARFCLQLLQGQDMSFDTKVFTDEGQKLWITCTMRSGTQSQVDDHCPLVSVPMDLVPEPGTKSGYWFISVKPMTETPSRFAQPAIRNVCLSPSNHECNAYMFDTSALRGLLLLTQISMLPRSQLHTSLHALEYGESTDAQDISTSGEWCIAEIVMTDDPCKLEAGMHEVNARWAAAGILNSVHALTDICRTEIGQGALLLLRSAPHPINMSLRSAVHEGVFKRVPTPDEVYNGVVTVDVPLAIETALHIARSLTLLHASSLVHGDLSDASVVVSMARHRSAPEERLAIGEHLKIGFATLGIPSSGVSTATPRAPSAPCSRGLPGGASMGLSLVDSQVPSSQDNAERGEAALPSSGTIDEQLEMMRPVYLDDLAATRSDFPMFYAPERFDRFGQLLPTAEPSADVWALGVLLIYMLRVSLPLLKDGPLALQQKARQGTLLTDVLQIDETTSPDEAGTLISLCLSSNPLSRPSAARCAAALEHIKATLAADTDALPEMPATDAP